MLKIVSLSLSLVGRIPGGGVPFKRRLLNLPEMIRTESSLHRHDLAQFVGEIKDERHFVELTQ